ncbi:MAG TPA: hypothetical protein PLV76_05880, partial [Spirochaetales bacterium]|nr:hypothetical protein [Spirochaetales bacterium]
TLSIFSPVSAFIINPIMFSNSSQEVIDRLSSLIKKTPLLLLGNPPPDNKLSQWLNDRSRIIKVISYSFTITELGKELFEAQWELTHHEE